MIYFKEGAWRLDQITPEEQELILRLGTIYAAQLLGYAILRKMEGIDTIEDALKDIPKENMGHA